MEAIVLAGGQGTRLREVVRDIPKPMAPVAGKPFLWFVLRQLETQGFERVCISTGFRAEVIKEYFGDRFGDVELTYSHEEAPLGTGGAILKAINELAPTSSAFVLNGDSFLAFDAEAMYAQHQQQNANFTIAVARVPDASRYGALDIRDGRVIVMAEKKRSGPATISAGIYLIRPELLQSFHLPEVFSFEDLVVKPAAEQGILKTFLSDGYFIDIGVPDDYQRAQTELPEVTSHVLDRSR